MVSKGDKVEFSEKGNLHQGVVIKKTIKSVKVRENVSGLIWTIPVALENILKPAIFNEVKVELLKVGDKVKFLNGETWCFGVIKSIKSDKYHITKWEEPSKGWKVPVALPIELCDMPDVEVPEVVRGYEVRRYQEYPRMSEETIAFNADIYFQGKKFAEAENSGHGGQTNVYGNNEMVEAFQKATDDWERECGVKKPFESYNTFIEWYVNERPYGVTSAMYFKRIESLMQSFV